MEVVVLASGQGSNLQALIDYERDNNTAYHIVRVISNVRLAPVLRRAKDAGIPTGFVRHSGRERKHFEKQLEKIVSPLDDRSGRVGVTRDPDLIVLAGFMRILSPYFINRFKNKIINIHPSLLPKFPGMHAIKQALNAGVSQTGCTVHMVDCGVDTGRILAQSIVDIEKEDTLESLSNCVQHAEWKLLPRTVDLIARGKIEL